MTELIVSAYLAVSQGWSADRVLADPGLNEQFVDACRQGGLKDAAVDLNLRLLNIRKRAQLRRSSRRTIVKNQAAFAFAAEIAIRCLERKYTTTLDRVLCDPTLAREFDSVAAAIAPGFEPMAYRWAALRLRKANRLKPEVLGRVVPSEVIGPCSIDQLDLSSLATQQGIYVLLTRASVLYVGEAKDLRARLKKHLEHSDNKLLARHLWDRGQTELLIECHILPISTRADVRRAMELELIRSRRPEFNVRR